MTQGPTKPQERCPRCGAALPAGPEGQLCARRPALAIDEIPTPPGDTPSVPLAVAAAPIIGEDVPEWIGPYHLLSVLGSGGMGVVFLAEQEKPVRRRVALKVIKLGMDSKEVIARFESERQALALMDHPEIAKVLDAGRRRRAAVLRDGARGGRADHRVLRRRTARAPGSGCELFVQVCDAVQHAHQKGIIHRDLKPSNVLVTVHRRQAGAEGHRLRRGEGDEPAR